MNFNVHYLHALTESSSNYEQFRLRYGIFETTHSSSDFFLSVCVFNKIAIWPSVLFSFAELSDGRVAPAIVEQLDYTINSENSSKIHPSFTKAKSLPFSNELMLKHFLDENRMRYNQCVNKRSSFDKILNFLRKQNSELNLDSNSFGIFFPFSHYYELVSHRVETDMILRYWIPNLKLNEKLKLHIVLLNQGSIIPIQTEFNDSALNALTEKFKEWGENSELDDINGVNAKWETALPNDNTKTLKRVRFVAIFSNPANCLNSFD